MPQVQTQLVPVDAHLKMEAKVFARFQDDQFRTDCRSGKFN